MVLGSTLPLVLLGALSTPAFVSAQDYVIQKIDIPDGASIVSGSNFLSFVNATVSSSFDFAVNPIFSLLLGLSYRRYDFLEP